MKTLLSLIVILTLAVACNRVPDEEVRSAQQNPIATVTAIASIAPSATAIRLPSKTPTPTISPTQTSTPIPTLVAHEWASSEPLITFGSSGGDGGCGFESALPSRFALLSNGELYIVGWNNELGIHEIKSTTLSRQSTCNLLNSIDQAGFFDYDPSTYINDPINWFPPIIGAGTTHISVQAWRSNSVSLYGLGSFIRRLEESNGIWNCADCADSMKFPTILPAIRKTYQLLANYQPLSMEIYQSDRVGLWVDVYPDTNSAAAWSLSSVQLSKIVSTDGSKTDNPNVILTGANAETVYQLFHQNINVCGISVTEGDKVYRVFARPLLPHEYLSKSPTSSTTLSCTPSDGWVEVP